MKPDIQDREQIAVDVERLAKILGVKPNTVHLQSWMDRYAAGAITDALRGDEKRTADIAISNTRHGSSTRTIKAKTPGFEPNERAGRPRSTSYSTCKASGNIYERPEASLAPAPFESHPGTHQRICEVVVERGYVGQ